MGHEMGQIWNNDYLVTANLMLMESNERFKPKEVTRKRMEYACLKFHNKSYNIDYHLRVKLLMIKYQTFSFRGSYHRRFPCNRVSYAGRYGKIYVYCSKRCTTRFFQNI